MPCAGDIPKPLARHLLKILTRSADWDRVERRFRGAPLEDALVRAAMTWPGLLVSPGNGGFIGAPAYVSQQLHAQMRGRVADAVLVQTYRRALCAYADDDGTLKGSVGMTLNERLGSFPGIDVYFLDFKHCLNAISDYRERDRMASTQSHDRGNRWVPPIPQGLEGAMPSELAPSEYMDGVTSRVAACDDECNCSSPVSATRIQRGWGLYRSQGEIRAATSSGRYRNARPCP